MSSKLSEHNTWINKVYFNLYIEYATLFYNGINSYLYNHTKINSLDKILFKNHLESYKQSINEHLYMYNKLHCNDADYHEHYDVTNKIPYKLSIIKIFRNLSNYFNLSDLSSIDDRTLLIYILNPEIISNYDNSLNLIKYTLKIINEMISFGILFDLITIECVINTDNINTINNNIKKLFQKKNIKSDDPKDFIISTYTKMTSNQIYNYHEFKFHTDMDFSCKQEAYDYLTNLNLVEYRYDYNLGNYYSKYDFLCYYGDLFAWQESSFENDYYKEENETKLNQKPSIHLKISKKKTKSNETVESIYNLLNETNKKIKENVSKEKGKSNPVQSKTELVKIRLKNELQNWEPGVLNEQGIRLISIGSHLINEPSDINSIIEDAKKIPYKWMFEITDLDMISDDKYTISVCLDFRKEKYPFYPPKISIGELSGGFYTSKGCSQIYRRKLTDLLNLNIKNIPEFKSKNWTTNITVKMICFTIKKNVSLFLKKLHNENKQYFNDFFDERIDYQPNSSEKIGIDQLFTCYRQWWRDDWRGATAGRKLKKRSELQWYLYKMYGKNYNSGYKGIKIKFKEPKQESVKSTFITNEIIPDFNSTLKNENLCLNEIQNKDNCVSPNNSLAEEEINKIKKFNESYYGFNQTHSWNSSNNCRIASDYFKNKTSEDIISSVRLDKKYKNLEKKLIDECYLDDKKKKK